STWSWAATGCPSRCWAAAPGTASASTASATATSPSPWPRSCWWPGSRPCPRSRPPRSWPAWAWSTARPGWGPASAVPSPPGCPRPRPWSCSPPAGPGSAGSCSWPGWPWPPPWPWPWGSASAGRSATPAGAANASRKGPPATPAGCGALGVGVGGPVSHAGRFAERLTQGPADAAGVVVDQLARNLRLLANSPFAWAGPLEVLLAGLIALRPPPPLDRLPERTRPVLGLRAFGALLVILLNATGVPAHPPPPAGGLVLPPIPAWAWLDQQRPAGQPPSQPRPRPAEVRH